MSWFLAALLVLPWPLPCADAGTCWIVWDRPAARVEWYEIISGDLLCARQRGYINKRGRFRAPRTAYWPHPGDGCWEPGRSREYRVIACSAVGCGEASEAVRFGPQEFRCYTSSGEVPCG